jgi:uncharacterized membrane protein
LDLSSFEYLSSQLCSRERVAEGLFIFSWASPYPFHNGTGNLKILLALAEPLKISAANLKKETNGFVVAAITSAIDINEPLRTVYNQWTQFEELPYFMEGVTEVRQESDNRLFWKAKIGGKVKRWEAEIVEQVPDRKIAWRSVDGSPNAGEITFEKLDSGITRVTASIEYEPEGLLERTGNALGIPSNGVERDLQRFRDYIEQRGRESGAWRGRIPDKGKTEAVRAAKEEGLKPEKTSE